MIKTILIDDEKPALRDLEYLLQKIGGIEVAGMYTNPFKGIEAVAEEKPHAVFLDISMPQLMGTDAAGMIFDRCPETNIVFVTAYDKYAVEAFELYALDYILKPVTEARLEKTMERLRGKPKSRGIHGKRLSIRCLGAFEIGWEGEQPIRWRTEKTRELFAFLLHNRGRTVQKDEIIEAVWPDAEPERASHQLHNAVYYIRKTLSDYGISREQLCISGCYRLEPGGAETDVDRFIERCGQIKSNSFMENGIDIYAGEYFADTGWLWAEPERERFEKEYALAALALAEDAMNKGRFTAAEIALTNAYRHTPYEEGVTALLLTLYARTGGKTKAVRHYNDYVAMLRNELNIKPGRNIIELMDIFME